MLDYLAYGAIGIAMATTILAFRLLTREQKKENPNESILKMIKWFMGLTVFFSLFFGVVELLDSEEISEISVESAAEHLSNSDSTEYVFNSIPGSQKAAVYLNYGKSRTTQLGELSDNEKIQLKGVKGLDKGLWKIVLGRTVLGEVNVDVDEYRLMADSTHAKHFNVKEWYPIGESDFWFRINSILGTYPNYLYTVGYGEGHVVDSIIPSTRSLEYFKTSDGLITLGQKFKLVRNDDWKRQYYVKFGAGLATHGSLSVQKINVQVIGLNVE